MLRVLYILELGLALLAIMSYCFHAQSCSRGAVTESVTLTCMCLLEL